MVLHVTDEPPVDPENLPPPPVLQLPLPLPIPFTGLPSPMPAARRRPILHRVLTLSSIETALDPSSAFIRLTKVRSVDNLLVLAQDPAFQREARKVVWRPSGEKRRRLVRWEDIVKHAARGATRAGTLAFGIRAGVNLVLMLFRAWRTKRLRIQMVLHAIFGEDSFRFAAMLGSFVGLYKLFLNGLPLLRQQILATATGPPSGSSTNPTTPKEVPGTPAGEKNDDGRRSPDWTAELHPTRWETALAGAISSLALLFEKKHRRIMIAQQVFVRGLQAVVLAHNLVLPHGAVLTFGLACGQIMYAFLLRPETIPRGYNEWIQNASKVTKEAVLINRHANREGRFDPAWMRIQRDRKTTTIGNRDLMNIDIAHALKGDFGPPFIPCEAVHPWIDSCLDVPLDRFVAVAKWMAPVYTALHLIPALLFRPKRFMQQPVLSLLRTAGGILRSCSFLGIFVVIYQGWFCFKHQMWLRPGTPEILRKFFASRFSFWLGGFMSCASLFVEEKKRRGELAMYVLPKALESAWGMLRSRKLVFKVPRGDAVLAAIGMAMVMNSYQHDSAHLSRLVRGILYQFIGPN
ncbi:hypothetical protein CALVIDRAFT_494229 [Calocera viscosa TUFC12733]|uniref:Transmembrane protein 135 N-terminal domain-containing protein n=1 Tax=Calocera viscosa (strain TUFC12733) TaxID=1330018 RepID=A0A167QTH8_CALVF|nr:hypothetical protein CALVIDRAFT_494229 [Calocera viscosa TUFC12733]